MFKLHFIQCHSTALLLKRQPGITYRVKGAIGHHDPAHPDALGSYRNYLAKELEELSAREPLRHRKQGEKKKKKGAIFCSAAKQSTRCGVKQENSSWPLGTAWEVGWKRKK